MNYHLIWQAALILIVGIMLIRLSGRRSISQMTMSETVIMISIGTLLIQPIANKNIWLTFVLAAVLVITLFIVEFMQLKWDVTETFFTGRSNIVVENGKINEENLRKLRLTVDKLEIRLRQKGIENIADLQWATIEPSGQLGYSLMEKKKYATKADIDMLQAKLDTLLMGSNHPTNVTSHKEINQSQDNIFSEIKTGHKNKEDHLQ